MEAEIGNRPQRPQSMPQPRPPLPLTASPIRFIPSVVSPKSCYFLLNLLRHICLCFEKLGALQPSPACQCIYDFSSIRFEGFFLNWQNVKLCDQRTNDAGHIIGAHIIPLAYKFFCRYWSEVHLDILIPLPLYMSFTCGRATGIEVKGWAVSGLSIYKERSERIDIWEAGPASAVGMKGRWRRGGAVHIFRERPLDCRWWGLARWVHGATCMVHGAHCKVHGARCRYPPG